MSKTTGAGAVIAAPGPSAGVARLLRSAAEIVEQDEDLLHLEEVAKLANVSLDTLRYWRFQGTGGPPTFRLGRRVVARRSAVLAWIAAREAADRRPSPAA